MTSLSSLLGTLMATLQSHPICELATVVETKVFSPDQFFFKVRAEFTGGYNFQARIYYNQGYIDYAYQILTMSHLFAGTIRRSFTIWKPIHIISMMSKATSNHPF